MCASGSDGETGAFNGTAGTATPPTAAPTGSSGGKALLSDAANEYIILGNSGSYLNTTGTSGEIAFKFTAPDGDPGGTCIMLWLDAGGDGNDELRFQLTGTCVEQIQWEDNNGDDQYVNDSDCSAYDNDWYWFHIRWDSTRGTNDEICYRYRVDGDANQAWDDDWTSWTCDTIDISAWAETLGAGEITIGFRSTYDTSYIDDIEFKSSSSW